VTNLNSYVDSVGTTTITAITQTSTGSSGLFTYWRSYGIQYCIDGTSNTIAFSEALVGDNTTNWTHSAGIAQLALPASIQVLDASVNWPAVQVGAQICNTAWNNRSGTLNTGRGNYWFHGTLAQTMFNTVLTPNSQQYPWAFCATAAIGDAEFATANSNHPGGVNTLLGDGSVRFIKNSINQAEARKPNILIILSDDHGYADVGFQGCRDIPTPNLDTLAQRGVRFTNGYVSGPYCSPTRAGLLTGRYQQRFGHEFNPGGAPKENFGLPLSETTIADRLKAAGYVTGLVGKWHLGSDPQFLPQRRGFDEFFGFLGGGHSYLPGQGAPIYRGTEEVKEKEYLTDAFAREAVNFIERHQRDPFFLYLAFNAVHTPMHATDARLERFASITDKQRRTYAAMLTALDEGVGRVLDTLRAAELERDTLIVFLSDNGGPTMRGTTINGSRNDPLRGSKRTTLEGGIRVPFLLSWKGSLPEGTRFEQPVIQLDVLPTVLAAAGVKVESDWKLDGVNLIPYVKGETSTPPHDALYWRLGAQTAIRQGDWKLVSYDRTADETNKTSDVTSEPDVTKPRLYNLARDIGETEDLSGANPQKVAELENLWKDWASQLKEPLWRPNNSRLAGAVR